MSEKLKREINIIQKALNPAKPEKESMGEINGEPANTNALIAYFIAVSREPEQPPHYSPEVLRAIAEIEGKGKAKT